MSFLAPLAFLGALLAVPIILLYMLRLRRREVVISSTFLWQQILQDREANTPWQRLRRNLLLLLQLIILALMVLALARPFLTVPTVSGGQTALLLDASASMNASDVDGGTRFEEAKRRALEIVNTLAAGNQMTIISVGSTPQPLTPYTTDRTLLQTAINNAQPTNGAADWLAAITLAAAGGSSTSDFRLVIIGDGGLGEANNLPEISIPGEVSFIPIGTSDENVAITALAARTLPGEAPQLFASLTNYGSSEAEVVFSLRDGDSLLLSETYTVPAQGEQDVIQPLSDNLTLVQADLALSVNSQAQDYLPTDNRAWTTISTAGERRALLVSEGNVFLEQVFASLGNIEIFNLAPGRPLPSQPYDLYIFDGNVPNTLPTEGDILVINPPQNTALLTVGEEVERVGTITVTPNDERTRFVDFGSVSISAYRQVEAGDWADVLIAAEDGPLLLAGQTGSQQIAVFTFALNDSNLPLQITYPILISNLLEWFTPSSVLTTTETVGVGGSVTIRPPLEADQVRVTDPEGQVREFPVTRESLVYTDTTTTGIYTLEVLAAEDVIATQTFPVNLFEPLESDITPREVTIGGQVVGGEVREELGQQEYYWLVILLALLVLLIEWYAYHRRLQVPTLLGQPRRARGLVGASR